LSERYRIGGNIQRSGTRKEETAIPGDELSRTRVLREVRSPAEAMELLIAFIEKSCNNAEFLTKMNQL
jgi:transcription termination factor Rho